MAYTRTWDPARPLGNQPARNADDEIRFLRVDMEDRFKDLLGIADFTLDPLKPTYLKPTDGTTTSELNKSSVGSVSASDFALKSTDLNRWRVTATGHFTPETDATYDFGSASKRVRDLYISGSITDSADLALLSTGGGINLSSNNTLKWTLNTSGHWIPSGDNLYDLGSNAARVRSVYTDKIYVNDINSDIDGGTVNITTIGLFDIKFRPNSVDRWVIAAAGHFEPATDNSVNIGSSTKRINTLHIAGNIYTTNIGTIGGTNFGLHTNSTTRWVLQSAGHFVPNADNTYDLGSTSFRPRDVFIGRHLEVDGQAYNKWYDAGSSGVAKTIDWDNGNIQKLTLTGNATLTLSNPKQGAVYTLYLPQDATGNRNITWPASVKWGANGAPDLTTTGSKIDVVSLLYDGTSYLGFIGGYGY